jgi:hypothetical protein
MCCGQKRTELQTSESRKARTTLGPASPPTRNMPREVAAKLPMRRSVVSIRYLEHSPIRVRGVVSGVYYEFSSARPVLQVDARDSVPLLNTRFFRRL